MALAFIDSLALAAALVDFFDLIAALVDFFGLVAVGSLHRNTDVYR
jgi:hypothetical protein